MHGFINSPALSKLVALQMVDDQLQEKKRKQPRKTPTSFRGLFLTRRSNSARSTARVVPTGRVVEDV